MQGTMNKIHDLTWETVKTGDTSGTIAFPDGFKKELLLQIRNTNGGTQFGSAVCPNAGMPSALVVPYNNTTMIFNRSGSTLTYTPVSGYAVNAYVR